MKQGTTKREFLSLRASYIVFITLQITEKENFALLLNMSQIANVSIDRSPAVIIFVQDGL